MHSIWQQEEIGISKTAGSSKPKINQRNEAPARMRIFLNWYMQKLPAPGAVTFLVDVTLRLRAARVTSRVIFVLSPLFSLSQIKALRRDVDKLANSAIDESSRVAELTDRDRRL